MLVLLLLSFDYDYGHLYWLKRSLWVCVVLLCLFHSGVTVKAHHLTRPTVQTVAPLLGTLSPTSETDEYFSSHDNPFRRTISEKMIS